MAGGRVSPFNVTDGNRSHRHSVCSRIFHSRFRLNRPDIQDRGEPPPVDEEFQNILPQTRWGSIAARA
jgi:hypothetical protein